MSRTLLVATNGGHITELIGFRDRIVDLGDHDWITNDHPQTRRLLADETVRYVPLIESRDIRGVASAIPDAVRTLRSGRYNRVVSTGSAIALAYLPVAAALGLSAHYIESSTRIDAPSVTGRLLAQIPRIRTWWQYADAPKGWRSLDGLYAHFSTSAAHEATPVTSAVITVGTTDYDFRRLIERLVDVIPAEVDVFWQVGNSVTSGLDIEAHTIVDGDELRRRIAKADVVVSHAGAGSLLQCLEMGHVPVYVPRRAAFGEQIDDHQLELANWAGDHGLAIAVDAGAVTWQHLVDAASRTVTASMPTPIELEAA